MAIFGDIFWDIVDTAFGVFVFAVFVCIYFLPAIIGFLKNHKQKMAIFILNLLFGWTFIGWGIALIWAFVN